MFVKNTLNNDYNHNDEFLDSELLRFSPVDGKDGSNSNSTYTTETIPIEKKIKLMKMIDIFERRSKMLMMDFWLPAKVMHSEFKSSVK